VKRYVFIVFTLLGIGRNLPFQGVYVSGLGIADLLFVGLALHLLMTPAARRLVAAEAGQLRGPLVAMAWLSFFALLSLTFNASLYGVAGKDVLEIAKYFYLLGVTVVAAYCTRAYGVAPVAGGFALGAVVSGVVAYLNPMNPDVFGTPQIFNPNVIGNVLSVAVVLCSFVILKGHLTAGASLAVSAAAIAFFTFSKGTWLMSTLGLVACYLALHNNRHHAARGVLLKYGKYLAYLVFLGLAYVIYEAWEIISVVVATKIAVTEFEATAAEGGSASARYGLIMSAVLMFLRNPLLGVGISNYEVVNREHQMVLGDDFYDDDNPNSAWFYVLGCMGLPAFLLFGYVFFWFVKRLHGIPFSSGKVRLMYTGCVALVFFIGGNVQLEMLTAYYFWVALGAVSGWTYVPRTRTPRARRAPKPDATPVASELNNSNTFKQ